MCLKEKGKLYRNKPIMSYYYEQKVQSQFWPFFADRPSKVKYKMYDLFMCWLRKSQKELWVPLPKIITINSRSHLALILVFTVKTLNAVCRLVDGLSGVVLFSLTDGKSKFAKVSVSTAQNKSLNGDGRKYISVSTQPCIF